jgi:hypothetical protein
MRPSANLVRPAGGRRAAASGTVPPRQHGARPARRFSRECGARCSKTLATHPERVGIDADLLHLFRSWFNRGFLILQRIDWHTPAVILERLIQYEAVHQIQGWRDLRRRLEGDRGATRSSTRRCPTSPWCSSRSR